MENTTAAYFGLSVFLEVFLVAMFAFFPFQRGQRLLQLQQLFKRADLPFEAWPLVSLPKFISIKSFVIAVWLFLK